MKKTGNIVDWLLLKRVLKYSNPYRKKLFKISEINPNEFWLQNKNQNFRENHKFLWLNLIDRKVDGKSIQKIIYLWMFKYSKFKKISSLISLFSQIFILFSIGVPLTGTKALMGTDSG